MKKIRTFIAHPVPVEWKGIIGEAANTLSKGLKSRVAWVKPENMHFTLKFLGDVPKAQLPEIDAALKSIVMAPFEISQGKAGFFPAPSSPRVIWVGLLQGAKEFCSNAAAIDSNLSELGFEKNSKSCHAHLTLGRVKKIAKDDWLGLAEKINEIELPKATISNFTLYKSVLQPSGPVYSVLHKYGV